MNSVCEIHNLTYAPETDILVSDDCFAIIAAPVYGGKMAPAAKERMAAIKGSGTPCAVVAVYGNRSFENALADMAVSGLSQQVRSSANIHIPLRPLPLPSEGPTKKTYPMLTDSAA